MLSDIFNWFRVKTDSLSEIFAWAGGLVILWLGFGFLNVGPGVLLLIATGIFALPPVHKQINKRFEVSFPQSVVVGVIVVGVTVGMGVLFLNNTGGLTNMTPNNSQAPIEPEWFFSTIAQATAASIGFLIAFLAALYTARKSKTQYHYMSLMDSLDEIEEIYNPILGRMERQLTGVTSFPSYDGTIESAYEIDKSQSEIQDIAEQYSQPIAIQMFANLKRSQKILDQIILPQPNNIKLNYITRLNETAKWMVEAIETAGSANEFLSDTSIGHLEPEEARNEEVFPKVGTNSYPGMDQNRIETFTFRSWVDTLKKFRQKAARAAMWSQNSDLTVEFQEFKMVVNQIATLFFVGVVFPLLFLFSWSPDWWISFTSQHMAVLELVTTGAVAYHTIGLFSTVVFILNESNKLG